MTEMLQILVIDDEAAQREIVGDILQDAGYEVHIAGDGEQGLAMAGERPFHVVLTDLKMPGKDGLDVLNEISHSQPDCQVIIMTAFGTIPGAVQAIKKGAYDYLTKPFRKEDLLHVVARAAEKSRLLQENKRLKDEISSRYKYGNLIGRSQAMQRIYHLIERIKDIDATVLISGESGTGKELVARAIHFSGRRTSGPFVAINCGAIPETLIESELFGHVRGAFTGAERSYAGRFEQAQGGTIFLDEIGTMRPDLQIRLLRVLQEKQVQRVGASRAIELDVRVIAATNEDLQAKVAAGNFRADLYHRLNVFHIELPPLRERGPDIALLARHFIKKYGRQYQKEEPLLSPEALQALEKYDFPGNVRELENIIEKTVILSDNKTLTPADIVLPERNLKSGSSLASTLPAVEEQLIRQNLKKFSGSLTRTARELGITYKTLQYRLKKYGIDRNAYR